MIKVGDKFYYPSADGDIYEYIITDTNDIEFKLAWVGNTSVNAIFAQGAINKMNNVFTTREEAVTYLNNIIK